MIKSQTDCHACAQSRIGSGFVVPSVPVIAVFVGLLATLVPGEVDGRTDVAVAYHGPLDKVPVFRAPLEQTGQLKTVRQLPLSDDSGSTVLDEFRFLPDGSYLFTRPREPTIALGSSDADKRRELSVPDQLSGMSSVAVETFGRVSEPIRFLVGSTRAGKLAVYSTARDEIMWSKNYRRGSDKPEFVGLGVVAPNEFVVGIYWGQNQLSAVEKVRFDVGYPAYSNERRAFQWSNRQYVNSEWLKVDEKLGRLQDLVVRRDGTILALSESGLMAIEPDGSMAWSVDRTQSPRIQGQLVAMYPVSEQTLAVATRKHGKWTEGHENHRVYWLDRKALRRGSIEVQYRSSPLERAPKDLSSRVDGSASGRIGSVPGLGPSSGQLSSLELTAPPTLARAAYDIGDRPGLSYRVKNTGSSDLSVERLSVRVTPEDCEAPGDRRVKRWLKTQKLSIPAGEGFTFRRRPTMGSDMKDQKWCGVLIAVGPDGQRRKMGNEIVFRVGESSGHSGNVSSEVIGTPNTEPGGVRPVQEGGGGTGGGCGCDTGNRVPGGGAALLFAILGWFYRRR